jgi:Putative prokaryotic signal transducing protein
MDGVMNNWCRIFATDKNYEAAIIKGKLEENNIPVMIFNKQDSSYIFLGEIEIHVPIRYREKAIRILDESNFE